MPTAVSAGEIPPERRIFQNQFTMGGVPLSAISVFTRPGSAANARTVDAVPQPVSYTHLRAHETVLDLVCRLLIEKKKKNTN